MRAILAPALVAAAVTYVPVDAVHAQSASEGKSLPLETAVDTTVKPGDDFFGYANGIWLRNTELPPGAQRWGARNDLEALTRRRTEALLNDARSAAIGTTARKVADFRAAYLNTAAIEAKGLTPLAPLLDSIERVQDKTGLARLLGSEVPADVDPLGWGIYESSHVLGLAIEQSLHGEKTVVAFLVEGGLGLPERVDYFAADSASETRRTTYRAYVSHLLSLAGFDRGDERAAGVLALETELARSHATREASAADHNADSVWEREHFVHLAPGLDWPTFLAAAGLDREDHIVAWQPSALRGLAALVASEPLSVWKDYLRFHALHDYADALPHAFSEQAMALRVATKSGAQPSREERALAATQLAMGDALGRMYAERYFPVREKARIERISTNIRTALMKRVEGASWMSPATKASSLTKLRTLYVGIGYPDQWQDYTALTVDPADPLGNIRRASKRAHRNAIGRLGQPVDLKYWFIPPQTVGALLVFQQNSYVMSAALLEPPKYSRTPSDAAAYGSVGALLGHDFTHYIDALGADYDTEHRFRHWWTPEDKLRFEALAQPLVDQFAAYHPKPDLTVNGKLTLTENIADLGGLSAALDAFHQTLGARMRDTAYVHQQDREFFVAYARTLRRKITDAAMRAQVSSNDHAPEEYRVDTVRNLDAWYEAFDVRPGQRLYLARTARVRVW
jgi:predicted metalloendopeptidase